MKIERKTKRRIISAGLFAVFCLAIIGSGLAFSMKPAQANLEQIKGAAEAAVKASGAACPDTGLQTAICPSDDMGEALETVGDKLVIPVFRVALIQALLNLVQFVLDRVAYEGAVAIASAGTGQETLFYGKSAKKSWKQFGMDIAGEAIGTLDEVLDGALDMGFDLCSPGGTINASLNLGIKQRYQPENPKCDLLDVASNWENFVSDTFLDYVDPETRNEKMLETFASTLQPGRNELSASFRIAQAVDYNVNQEKILSFLEEKDKGFKDKVDFITGATETPSEVIENRFNEQLNNVEEEKWDQVDFGSVMQAGPLIGSMALSVGSTFVNTLLSTLMSRIYTGLFDTEVLEVDLWDYEATASTDREDAEERFASILAATPTAVTDYDVMGEFVVCIDSNIQNRNLNECVMDTEFYAAVMRGSTGSPLTVQEAIDEGLLDGDKPLISPEDQASNQDPNCYTYGYCYGNLVKLRKARVIPVGWELAALRSDETNPTTLQQVIDGFDDCTDLGTVGPANSDNDSAKWCHLIDPNWVLKYPDTQCNAMVNGEIRLSQMSNGRTTVCADSPSCIGENNEGECTDGYGYCVKERNVWRFRGDECPEEYATCLKLEDITSGDKYGFLLNTVDFSVCGQDNAGCTWYRTNKYFSDAGTEDDTSDDTYEWLPDGVTYETDTRDAVWRYQTAAGDSSDRATFAEYQNLTDQEADEATEVFSYEDRMYFTHSASECDSDEVGCTWLYETDDDITFNILQNPSFEDDEDLDNFPDFWVDESASATEELDDSGNAYYGSNAVVATNLDISQIVPVAVESFYTLSAYGYADDTGAGTGTVSVQMFDDTGAALDVSGTSYAGDCTATQTSGLYTVTFDASDTDTLPTEEWTRLTCTFTTTADVANVEVFIETDEIRFDAIQLELGEDDTIFATGYSEEPQSVYYKIAPDYLGCTGDETDPDDCGDYAQVCSAAEVGCNLYTPEDGDPSIPAIISELDECPEECVGYTTYKQEATTYDDEEFPVYFIASEATSCSEQYVGCDAFTNISSVEEGGEEVEHYTDLRACLTSGMADGSSTMESATFFTWEGSDNEGYQLQTWTLLESSADDTDSMTFNGSGTIEDFIGLAPCVAWEVTSENVVQCIDTDVNPDSDITGNTYIEDVAYNDECDEHDDIFENPNCREFFDTEGSIHYREYPDTISVDDDCTPYRKDESSESDCDASGGYWTAQGFCRYFGLPAESTECPSAQSGCREYTGGSGRNASTILSETFESGTYEDFVINEDSGTVSLSISNESIATEGHSLRVVADSGTSGFETVQIYLDSGDITETFDVDDETTCTDNGGTATDTTCDVENDVDGDTVADEECSIDDEEESCGALTDSLVAGKTFVVDFWAKGDGSLYVLFDEEGGSGTMRDMVDTDATISAITDLTAITLDGTWQLYSLGPLETTDFEDFDENAVLRFLTDGELYIDNISLKQTEENVTIIKDSWVIPSTCDTSPSGAESDQYYLGCEAYTDQNGNDVELYQFTDLCTEDAVGCDAFYHTSNSDSEYTQIFNARCVYDRDGDFSTEETATENVSCGVEGESLCTVIVGSSYCTFDVERQFADPLPLEDTGEDVTVDSITYDIYNGVVYGPETVVVEGDKPVYIVEDSSYECFSESMGCELFGEPTYNQNQSEVESFEDAYFINLPSEYDSVLCADEALFCEEFSSTQDGNWYFKDPLDKNCEYKTSITVDGQEYYGWFRTGISVPCYFDDDDEDLEWDSDSEQAYLIAGEEFGVWTNGDDDYDGWVGTCDTKYDLCTEFVDVVDTGGGVNEDGYSYYFTNDELLEEDTLLETQRCDGQVSQKFGCALFNNTTDSDLTYNAGASYVVSMHADVFNDDDINSLQDPVNCDLDEGGLFEISESDAALADISADADGNYYADLCGRRCMYSVDSGDEINTPSSDQFGSFDLYFERSCFVDDDCPVLDTLYGDTVSGTCYELSGDTYYLENDTNEILKVDRDRTCAAWLACESSRTSWNTSTNMYETVCDSIDVCVEGGSLGDQSTCTEWDDTDPVVLTDVLYSSRDVNWTGFEYSGYSIPDQLPVEYYDQFNLNPSKACTYTSGTAIPNDYGNEYSCSDASDCPDSTTSCTSNADCTYSGTCNTDTNLCYYPCADDWDDDYRLVYNAGPCDSSDDEGVGEGGNCNVGFCDTTGDTCSEDDDCSDSESCVIGYCQATGSEGFDGDSTSCDDDSDCSGVTSAGGVATEICDSIQQVCVDYVLWDDPNHASYDIDTATTCVDADDCSGDQSCVPADTTAVGSCFNNRCLTDIADNDGDNKADAIDDAEVRISQCRGYPEYDSPFPYEVVELWETIPDSDDDGVPDATGYADYSNTDPSEYWSQPYSFVSGYEDAIVCSPNDDTEANDDCLCSYDKIEYGDGIDYRYYESGTGFQSGMEGICGYGVYAGFPCDSDDDCGADDESTGTCNKVTRVDTLYGWEGYCLERDSSIQLNASAEEEDQACLTWLPVDQLSGATDLYGKYTQAGYPLENTYYCAETAYYYDLYPLNAAFDADEKNVDSLSYSCATSDTSGFGDCDYEEYNECYYYAYCPEGWVALVGWCDADGDGTCEEEEDPTNCNDGTWCKGSEVGEDRESKSLQSIGWEFDDCPMFCIPENSYHSGGSDIGESCDDDFIEASDFTITQPSTSSNVFGTKYVLVGDMSSWDGSSDTTVENKFKDCVVRGVPITATIDESGYDILYTQTLYSGDYGTVVSDAYGMGELNENSYGAVISPDDGNLGSYGLKHRPIDSTLKSCDVTDTPCQTDGDCPTDVDEYCIEYCAPMLIAMPLFYSPCVLACTSASWFVSFAGNSCETVVSSATRGSMYAYLACHEIVQAATTDSSDGNKAWTNRLLIGDYTTADPDGTFVDSEEYEFSASVTPDPAGAIRFEEYYVQENTSSDYWVIEDWGELDSFPLPVYSCDTNPDQYGWSGLGTTSPTQTCGTDSLYPGEQQYKTVGDADTLFLLSDDDPYGLGWSYEDVDEDQEGDIDEYENASMYGNSCDDGDCVDRATAAIDQTSVTSLLSQLFAKVYEKWVYEWDYDGTGRGAYEKVTDDNYGFDISPGFWTDADQTVDIDNFGSGADEFPSEDDRGPVVISVGDCIGTDCYEDDDDAFTVNGVDSGTIVGEGQKRVSASFYVYAQPNQLPLRNIIMDWGDDFSGTGSVDADEWPTGSQSGSDASDNFYMNHRGMDAVGNSNCDDEEWGTTSESCSSSYVMFSKDYVCTAGRLNQISSRACELDEDGNLLNSPCTGTAGGTISGGDGACVFQPRVHAVDNWGWCTGFCDSNSDDDSDACYGDECDFTSCPGSGCAAEVYASGTTSNPWVYFDGYVVVDPE